MTDRDFDEPEETPEDGDSPILTLEDVAVVKQTMEVEHADTCPNV